MACLTNVRPIRAGHALASGEDLADVTTPVTLWAVRLRAKQGFDWGRPYLAHRDYFAWHEGKARAHETLPFPIAVFGSREEASRRATAVRSRKLAARPHLVRALLMEDDAT